MVNSKDKGKRGEREFSKFCKKKGFEVRRTQQYAGAVEESADCVGLPGMHIEVKRVEKLNIDIAMKQAVDDCAKDTSLVKNIPMVAHRKNGKRWLITMGADDWFKLYEEWLTNGKNYNDK